MASCIYAFALVLFFLYSRSYALESDADRVSALRQMQVDSNDGVISLDDNGMNRFARHKDHRSYSLVIFFDAMKMRENTELKLQHLREEFGLLARSYAKNNEGGKDRDKVFFVDVEFGRSPGSFSLFEVKSLPHLKHLPPGTSAPKSADVMDLGEFARSADGMASFVEAKSRCKVGPIERPPRVSNKQLAVLVGLLLAISPFVIKKIVTANDTPLHDPRAWCALALFVYFFSVSGVMYNIIRGMPFLMADRKDPSKIVFFYQGSGMQLGAEGFAVGFLYTLVGVMLAGITHFLAGVKNKTAQRVAMYVMLCFSFWAVRKVIFLDSWKTGYRIHGFWPNRWR